MPICPVFGLVSRICPDLPISVVICLHNIGGQKLTQILSVYTKNCWRPGLRPELTTLLQTPKSDPPMAHACGAHTLRFAPLALVPEYGHLKLETITLTSRGQLNVVLKDI